MRTEILITLLLLLGKNLAQDGTQYEFVCGEKESVASKDTNKYDIEYEKTELMFLCLHLAPYGMMIPFKVAVDDFGLIEVKDCKKK